MNLATAFPFVKERAIGRYRYVLDRVCRQVLSNMLERPALI